MKRYTEAQARRILDRAIQKAGSQAVFADSNGISRQYLTDILKGRRDMSGKILDALGLDKVVEFQPKIPRRVGKPRKSSSKETAGGK